MKPLRTFVFAFITCLSLLMFTGCDWESGTDSSFSGSMDQNNISGAYDGRFSGGKAVDRTTRGNIVRLTVQQSGSSVTVRDNQGSTYTGYVSAPRLEVGDDSGIAAGTLISAWQISFSGRDEVAARDIEFTGTVTLGSITDIQSTRRERVSDRQNNSTTTVDTGPVTVGNVTTETNQSIIDDNSDNIEITSTFVINSSNGLLRMRGTWVEKGGVVGNVDAAAVANTLTVTAPVVAP